MRATHLFGLVSIFLLLLLFLVARGRSHDSKTEVMDNPAGSPSGSELGRESASERRVPFSSLSQSSVSQTAIESYLSLAEGMELDSKYARSGLTNLLIMLGISDSTAASAGLSDEQLVGDLSRQGLPADLILERLSNYPRGSISIEELYSRNEAIPGFNEVRAALANSGFEADPRSECLLDGLRFVASCSEMADFLQELQQSMSAGPARDIYAPLVETLARDERDVLSAFTRVFRDRFLMRYGMTDTQVDKLLDSLAALRVLSATTQDLYLSRP
jgi:hypothetical protein